MNRNKCTHMSSTKTLTFTLINIIKKPLLCVACMCAIKSRFWEIHIHGQFTWQNPIARMVPTSLILLTQMKQISMFNAKQMLDTFSLKSRLRVYFKQCTFMKFQTNTFCVQIWEINLFQEFLSLNRILDSLIQVSILII